MRVFAIVCSALFLMQGGVLASSQVMPPGLWAFSYSMNTSPIARMGVDVGGAVDVVNLNNFSVADSPILQGPDNTVYDSLKTETRTVELAYGLSPNTMFFASFPFLQREAVHNKAYQAATKLANDNAPPQQADEIMVPPDVAYGSGMGDATVGIKHRLDESTSVLLAYSGGVLNFGKDGREVVPIADGVLELPTGKAHDEWAVVFNKDFMFNQRLFHGSLGYINSSANGFENFLENYFEVDTGDQITLGLGTKQALDKSWVLSLDWTYLYAFSDNKIENGVRSGIPHSSTYAWIGKYALTYKPAIFFNLDLIYNHFIDQKAAAGSFDFPGKLFLDDSVTVKATLFMM